MRTKYKFSHRAGNLYYWESVGTIGIGESRHSRIICSVEWFWKGNTNVNQAQ